MTVSGLEGRARRRRRAAFFGLTFATSGFATFLFEDILSTNGLSPLEAASVVLFFALFTWISGAFWTAIAGFLIRLDGRDRRVIRASDAEGLAVKSRIALVMPVYNEDPTRVMAGLDAIWTSLAKEPEQAAFDLFILSDTRKDAIAAQEEAAWASFIERHGAAGRVFYRRRADNVGRKAGNIADFVTRWGGAYEHMLVLDADSVMSGRAIVTLARLMDAHPEVGIIQSAPLPAGRDTLFARMVQFGARLNGPMLSSGLAFWQLGEANYWGHNAILRIAPFAKSCALPRLPGAAPLGGEILSHDFVEAAFMRRAGHEVWLLADLEGSWEEVPSNIIDFAARDRRWAQGNMQHLGVLRMRGLHWLNRLHMLTGVLSYATSPIWFLVLIFSSILTCEMALEGHQYFSPGQYALFPTWPQYREGEIEILLTGTVIVLLLPKLLGATLAWVTPALRRGFGGGLRLAVSLLLEQIFSVLLAPPMMVFHSTFVVTTLAGKPVTWNAQERGDRGIGLGEAMLRHKWHIALGFAWGALILLMAPRFIWWMMPVIAGLLLSAPLTALTSRASVGRFLRRLGLLLTPEEVSPPAELKQLLESCARASERDGTSERGVRAGGARELPALPAPAPLVMEPASPEYLGMRSSLAGFARIAAAAWPAGPRHGEPLSR
ncbi:MAG TPA: glucans biosynthesis glucosyltransferase MdoH [Steroidobacteraceae bacterium]|nr:glucans biosynthesis glucosyltransferase MdoH [Steroidobacteraceae bacterium]